MAIAYTPGLRVSGDAVIRQVRRLPMKGRVLVSAGQAVTADRAVARAEMPGNLHTVRAAQMLHIEPQELEPAMLTRPGQAVKAGEVIAHTRGLFGWFRSELRSPVAGTVEEVSAVSGHVRIRERPRLVEVLAHVAGTVVEVIEGEGAVVEARGALVQGIFGIGGERRGPLSMVADGPDQVLHVNRLPDCSGCVLVAGAGAEASAIMAAAEAGAAGLVIGAVRDEALREYLGYDIGVAITGQEEVPMALILTEGFGELPMAQRTWELLTSLAGQLASINGATQIRAGVMRPEVIVTRAGTAARAPDLRPEQVLAVGSRVRVIRAPHFGALGKVTAMPAELAEIETESRVRVAMVELGDAGQEQAPAERSRDVRVPRANLEIVRE
jgi:hypothetical protein